jgi:steroid delta-isomerase-like uncharacterized protein
MTKNLFPILALTLAVGCAPSPDRELEANKELVQRFTDVCNEADWDALSPLVAEDFKRHSAATGADISSLDEYIGLQKTFMATFPDQKITLDQLLAEGEFVATRATYSGTHSGAMGESQAAGKSASIPFLAVFRVESGKLAEMWVEWDNLAMLSQLGLYPPPAGD